MSRSNLASIFLTSLCLMMIVFVNLLMADVFSGIVGKFSEINLL